MKKALKIIGIMLLGLVGLVLVLGLIAPKEFATGQSIRIEAPPGAVFKTVNDLSSWASWSPWWEMDPDMEVVLSEPAAGEGAYYRWEGRKAGKGKMSILTARPGDRVETEILFDGMGGARSDWSFAAVPEGTEVSWGFRTRVPYPFNGLFWLQGLGDVDQDFQRGLANLKEKVEAEASALPATYNGYVVEVQELPERFFAGVRRAVKMEEIQPFYAKNLGATMQKLSSSGGLVAGMPCGLYFSWDEASGQTDMAAAIPVAEAVDLGPSFSTIRLPAGKNLMVNYYGNYHEIGAAHTAIDQYVAAHGLKTGMPVIEQYVTDPGTEPDPAKWLTRVYYPVEE